MARRQDAWMGFPDPAAPRDVGIGHGVAPRRSRYTHARTTGLDDRRSDHPRRSAVERLAIARV
jgi:hypothetical protein